MGEAHARELHRRRSRPNARAGRVGGSTHGPRHADVSTQSRELSGRGRDLAPVEGRRSGLARGRSGRRTKSSGEIWSRNSRNFSTSSSSSSGIGDAGLVEHGLGAEDRRPGAQRQRDRVGRAGADTSTPSSKTSIGEEDAVVELGDADLGELVARGAPTTSRSRSWVSGRGGHDALLGEGDRGGLDGADPDRQVALTVDLAQQHDRLVRGHLDPDTRRRPSAHGATLARRRRRDPRASRQRRSSEASPALTSAACSRTDSAASSRIASSARCWPLAGRAGAAAA